MPHTHRFDPKNIERLESPDRKVEQNPDSLFSLMGFSLGGGFLDFGAGSGYFTFPAYDRFKDHGPFYAADIQPEMLEIFRQKSRERYGGEPISTLDLSDHRIPLPDEAVENAIMVNVFHELDDREATLSEILRVLKKGGSLFIVDWKKIETPTGPPMEERAEEADIYDSLLAAGFTRIRSWDVYRWYVAVQAIR